jgi:hypothetical protein
MAGIALLASCHGDRTDFRQREAFDQAVAILGEKDVDP